MTRKRFTERQVLESLIYQGVDIRCFRCKNKIETYQCRVVEREHLHELALGGPDTPENCRYSHGICHFYVTNGNKATSAGSSKQRIAKVRRLIAGPKQPKGRPLKSRGFQKPPAGYDHKWPSRKFGG